MLFFAGGAVEDQIRAIVHGATKPLSAADEFRAVAPVSTRHDRSDPSLPAHRRRAGGHHRRTTRPGRPRARRCRSTRLVAHIGGLSLAFAAAAGKEFGPLTDTPPADDAPLDADWRSAYPQRLAALAAAWKDPAAWEGMTRAGGVELPAEVMGDRRARRGRHPRLGRRTRHRRTLRQRSGHAAGVPGAPRAVRPPRAPRACSAPRCRPPTSARGPGPGHRDERPRSGLAGALTGHTGAMDPVVALRQIAYYKDRAREDSRRVMAYRNAADIVGGAQRSRARTPRRGEQLAVADRNRAEDGEGDRPGLGGPRARRARRITFGCSRISAAATSGRRCAAICTCTPTGPTDPRRSRR